MRRRVASATVASCGCELLRRPASPIPSFTGKAHRRAPRPDRKAGSPTWNCHWIGDNKAHTNCFRLMFPGPKNLQLRDRQMVAVGSKRRGSMKRLACSLAFAGVALLVLAAGLASRVAAQDSGIAGTVLDVVAKPWADIPVELTSDQGQKFDTKTDAKGHYQFINLRSGVYTISVTLPGQTEPYR